MCLNILRARSSAAARALLQQNAGQRVNSLHKLKK
jgi:hypothetical protein